MNHDIDYLPASWSAYRGDEKQSFVLEWPKYWKRKPRDSEKRGESVYDVGIIRVLSRLDRVQTVKIGLGVQKVAESIHDVTLVM